MCCILVHAAEPIESSDLQFLLDNTYEGITGAIMSISTSSCASASQDTTTYSITTVVYHYVLLVNDTIRKYLLYGILKRWRTFVRLV
jgi:hypothetical protein